MNCQVLYSISDKMNLTLLRLYMEDKKTNIIVQFLDVLFTFVLSIALGAFGLLVLNISYEFLLNLVNKFF